MAECGYIFERADRYAQAQQEALEQPLIVAEFERIARRAMIQMALVDGSLEARQLEMIGRLHQEVAGWTPSPAELLKEAAQIEAERSVLCGGLQLVAPQLSEDNKAQLFEVLYRVATAAGPISEAARSQIVMLPDALSLTVQECREIIARLPE
jgi:hypothetical protein